MASVFHEAAQLSLDPQEFGISQAEFLNMSASDVDELIAGTEDDRYSDAFDSYCYGELGI